MKKFCSLVLAIILALSLAVSVNAEYYDEKTILVSGVTANVNKNGSVTAGVNFMGTVDSPSTEEAVKSAVSRADIVGMDIIILYIPKGTVGLSGKAAKTICEAAGEKTVRICFLISDSPADRKIFNLTANHGQILADKL
ncbi:MAG: hypothetical protein LBL80_04330 [Ruminococcus sp.]|jgi:hypothetical protein|nr:hypothetical protein [Ruminococcus sp.]